MNDKFIDNFHEANKDHINDLFASKLSNDELYKHLKIVDLLSAGIIHPNDRRKICR